MAIPKEELERIQAIAKKAADVVATEIPADVGYHLMVFSRDKGWIAYSSNVEERQTLIKVLERALKKIRTGLN